MGLVLTRKVGELTYIGDDISVRVVEIKGGQVQLMFEAPKHVNIVREELLGRELKPRRDPLARLRRDIQDGRSK